jgi:acyl carrier protein
MRKKGADEEMLDKETLRKSVADLDPDGAWAPKLVDEVEEIVRHTAKMICAEQPDVPEPDSLRDLDSFSLVQVLLELENQLKMKLLERMENFEGETFRDLAELIVRLAYQDEEEQREAATAEPQDQPTPA